MRACSAVCFSGSIIRAVGAVICCGGKQRFKDPRGFVALLPSADMGNICEPESASTVETL